MKELQYIPTIPVLVLLNDLMALKLVRVQGSEYEGKAKDGVWVVLGNVGEEDKVMRYLRENPGPDKW